MVLYHFFIQLLTSYITCIYYYNWTNPEGVDDVEVIVIQVTTSVHITHVVIVVSRTQPEIKKDNREPILALPILFIY